MKKKTPIYVKKRLWAAKVLPQISNLARRANPPQFYGGISSILAASNGRATTIEKSKHLETIIMWDQEEMLNKSASCCHNQGFTWPYCQLWPQWPFCWAFGATQCKATRSSRNLNQLECSTMSNNMLLTVSTVLEYLQNANACIRWIYVSIMRIISVASKT